MIGKILKAWVVVGTRRRTGAACMEIITGTRGRLPMKLAASVEVEKDPTIARTNRAVKSQIAVGMISMALNTIVIGTAKAPVVHAMVTPTRISVTLPIKHAVLAEVATRT